MKHSISLLFVIAGLLVAGGASAQSGEDLLKSKNCLNCHAMDKKKMGPSFKDVAAKYKADKDASGKLVTALKEGKGHPVKAAATDPELKTMVDFVLSQK